MTRNEWCRSRYWLGHFLYSRHERSKIVWQSAVGSDDDQRTRLRLLLEGGLCARALGGERLIHRAAADYAHDPAYVQSLRLVAKERAYGDTIIERLGERFGITSKPAPYKPPLAAWLVSVPGVRFEVASLLLHDLVNAALIELAMRDAADPATRCVRDALLRDHATHITFYAERLTMEFADFHFVRRNLRRYRLRAMFSAVVTRAIRRHEPLLTVTGLSADDFTRACWGQFNNVLERMVPYRRDALLAALMRQSEHPYAKPTTV